MDETTLIREWLQSRQTEMIDLLRQLVEIETPSNDKPAMDAMARFVAAQLVSSGFRVELLPMAEWGDMLFASWGSGARRILALLHMDTVWPIGEVARRPFTIQGHVAHAPGANDMKSGIVALIFAVRALIALGIDPGVELLALFTSEEEVGSPASREVIARCAPGCSAAFIMEPGSDVGGIKTWRKGVGVFTVAAEGRAAHAGVDPEAGINAITEIAHQIPRIHALADRDRGTTVNAGLISGGSKHNVIPSHAEVVVDVRVKDQVEAARVQEEMHRLQPALPGARLRVSGGFSRGPMEKTELTARLFGLAERLSRELELPIAEEGSGGATDGNIVAQYGVPILDGLGPLGGKSHSVDEFCMLDTMPLRSALVARLLVELGRLDTATVR